MMNKWLSDEELWLAENGDEKGVDLGQLFDQAKEANRLREGLENIKAILTDQIESGDVYPRILRHHVRELLEGEE